MAAVDTIEALRVEVERNKSVDDSAIALLNGIAARIQAAVDAATAAGATAEQVAQTQALANSLKSDTDALAAAVTANTPAA
jgi:hypothetical protein